MKPREERICRPDTQEHEDAQAIVDFIFRQGGEITTSNEGLAVELGLWKNLGAGHRRTNMARIRAAKNHIRDRVDRKTGKPCCGYTIHYRHSGRESILTLIDPSGNIGSHATAAVASFRGWLTREHQHNTENQRQIETVEMLADHALANNDRVGFRLLQRVSIALDQDGVIPLPLMAEVEVWLGSL